MNKFPNVEISCRCFEKEENVEDELSLQLSQALYKNSKRVLFKNEKRFTKSIRLWDFSRDLYWFRRAFV